MKKFFLNLLCLTFAIFSLVTCTSTSTGGSGTTTPTKTWDNYAIGDTGPSGGFIFYINPNAATDGWKYLEASPSSGEATKNWGKETVLVDTTKYDIGSGTQNTLDIIAKDNTTDKAADYCANYSITNNSVVYDDWFLPSNNELLLMRTNLYQSGIGSFATLYSVIYWASSEIDNQYAKCVIFTTGASSGAAKYHFKHAVRPCRKF